MSVKEKDIQFYLDNSADLIPVHPWNKMKKGKSRGKNPVDYDWISKNYNKKDIKKFISKGYNLGYRIPSNELVIDIDPRNFEFEDPKELLQKLAEDLDFFDFDELTSSWPTVATGGGGWHIYTELPDDFDYRMIRETIEEYPGVEYKRKGRQVLCAGSRHPSGNFYKWITRCDAGELPESFITKITREQGNSDTNSDASAGLLTGEQLQEMILDQLDPENYSRDDLWFPLLCASHHVTNGDGIDQFVEWSIGDMEYEDAENDIRNRWESLWAKPSSITIGTLVKELDNKGLDTADLKAVLTFANMPSMDSDEDDSDEADMVSSMEGAADDIEIHDIYSVPETEYVGVEGTAIQAANNLGANSSDEEIMITLRLVKASSAIEREKATGIIVANKVLSKASINKLLKDLDARIIDDMALLLARKTLEKTFSNGKHLTVPPSGQLWAFHKTHWRELSDEFLAKLVQKILGKMKDKMDIEMQELALVTQAVKLARIEVSTLTDRIHSTDMPLPVINCKNGELWLDKDGQHSLRPHNYRTYLLNCLNVDYDPSAECPLFDKTLQEIFANFPDTDEMIRHIGEMMGYIIQPYKNIASWWLFRGPGGDGKSTLVNILGGILKDAQLSTTVNILSAGTEQGNAHAFASLPGKLAVVIEELPSNYLLRDTGVKMLSENAKREANPKGAKAFSFMYAGGLIMCSNHYPTTRDLSHGMIRRANVIPFNRQFTKDGTEDSNRVHNILSNPKEMAGVLNFMVNGLARLRERGNFLEPESCKETKQEWLNHGNNVVRFINETVERDEFTEDDRLASGINILLIYNDWCEINGVKPKGRNTFFNDLQELGFAMKKPKNQITFYGGLLKEDTYIDDFGELDDEL